MKKSMTPQEVFKSHCLSLMNILRVADVYALLQIDNIRGTSRGVEVAKEVIEKSGSSLMLHSKQMILSKEEQQLFEKDEYVTGVCQQTVQSSYAAIENYLIHYFAASLRSRTGDSKLTEAILNNLSFRSLEWIKKHYSKFLNIDLPSFNHKDICTYEESWFHPRDEWHGLKLLSDVRNEIAHDGKCTSFSIHYPVDAYAVIHFIERWVMFFELKYGEKST
jgi:hypothetical protein